MRVIQLFSELILIGGLALLLGHNLFALSFTMPAELLQNDFIVAVIFLILSWVIGFFINVFSEMVLSPLYRAIESRYMLREGNPSLLTDRMLYDLYVSSSGGSIVQRIEYHRSLIRLSRCIIFELGLFLLIALLKAQYQFIELAFFTLVIVLIAYYRSVIWSLKSTYHAWIALKQKRSRASGLCENKQLKNIEKAEPLAGINVVAFTGGTGFRDINMVLAHKTRNITRIVPIWDNGGSSKALRESFDLMPVGDIRHALMTQAHGEERMGAVVKLFNWRLPTSGEEKIFHQELYSFINNQHPLIRSIEQSLGNVIINYLQQFAGHMPATIDLKNGSIGNFVLVGAYLAHNKDINTAIYVFRQLCSIKGNVWPVSSANNLNIDAILEDGQIVLGQENITRLERSKNRSRIKRIFFSQNNITNDSHKHQAAKPDSMVLDALRKAEVIVYGPGSFFTSVLPHIMVDDIVNEISKRDVPKIFIGNLMEDNESYGYTLEELVDIFLTTANDHSEIKRTPNKYITHIIVNTRHAATKLAYNNKHYLDPGNTIKRFSNKGISLIFDDFENPWQRGGHDPERIVDLLVNVQL